MLIETPSGSVQIAKSCSTGLSRNV